MKTEAESEARQAAPYPIRAHHLFIPRDMFPAALLPSPTNRERVNAVISHQTVLFLYWATSSDADESALGQEYLGEHPYQTFKGYKERLRSTMEAFMQLAEDAPVALITRPDGICAACVRGTHCQENQQDEIPYLSRFIQVATFVQKVAGTDYTLTTQEGRLMRIDTTKGTVRDVLNAYDAYLASLPDQQEQNETDAACNRYGTDRSPARRGRAGRAPSA